MFLAAIIIIFATITNIRAGNTTCKTTSLDWYTQSVGETPCRTYERLRQICNANFQVGNFRPDPPGDQCDDQVWECCRNSVAFSLSMLCQNCQYGVGSGVGGDTGIDGAKGTYRFYLQGRTAVTNMSLPELQQDIVCKKGILIPQYAYDPFWREGDWYYMYTRDRAGVLIAAGTNTTKYCANATMSSSTIQPTSSSSPTPDASATQTNASGPNVLTIVGGTVGGVGFILIAAAVLTFWFIWRRHRRSRSSVDLTEESSRDMIYESHDPPSYDSTSGSPGTTAQVVNSHRAQNKLGARVRASPSTARTQPLPSSPTVSSSYFSDRHEDSVELTQLNDLGWSNAGTLPPVYQER